MQHNNIQLIFILGPSTSKDTVCEPPQVVEERGLPSPSQLVRSVSTQTPHSLSSYSPRKNKLKAEIKDLRKRLSSKEETLKKEEPCSLEHFHKLCDIFLDSPLADIIKSHTAMKGKKRISHRYSKEIKQFALTIYFLSPRAYHFLSNLLTLPTKRTLQRLTEQLSCKPGLKNKGIFRALELKSKTMYDKDKHCILCIDEMSLKSNLLYDTGNDEIIGFQDIGKEHKDSSICKNALVVMARGLYSPWKQPLAYFFVGNQLKASELKPIMEDCVIKMSETGFHVEAISSDMGSNFLELASSFGVTPENSEFKIGILNLLYIFDPCHLVKATRNNLLKHSFHFEGKKTSWEYIDTFYKNDKKQFYRCAPKLTDSHLHPSNFEKLKVRLASQVLSHTVASGMNMSISLGVLPSEAFATVETIERFNNLFDMLNAFSLRDPNKFKTVYEGSQFQIDFLKETIDFLSQLRIMSVVNQDITNSVKFIKCWIITINSTIKLWEKLSNLGFKYLKTRRLNTDCLENFLAVLDSKAEII